jgi:hypothetical protein
MLASGTRAAASDAGNTTVYEGLLAIVQPLLRDGTFDFSLGRPLDAVPGAID